MERAAAGRGNVSWTWPIRQSGKMQTGVVLWPVVCRLMGCRSQGISDGYEARGNRKQPSDMNRNGVESWPGSLGLPHAPSWKV